MSVFCSIKKKSLWCLQRIEMLHHTDWVSSFSVAHAMFPSVILSSTFLQLAIFQLSRKRVARSFFLALFISYLLTGRRGFSSSTKKKKKKTLLLNEIVIISDVRLGHVATCFKPSFSFLRNLIFFLRKQINIMTWHCILWCDNSSLQYILN